MLESPYETRAPKSPTPERLREEDDIKALMSTAEGRRFAWRMLGHAGIYRTSYTGDAGGMAYNEGRRSVGLWLMAEINDICPEQYLLMIKEQHDDRNSGNSGSN